MADRADLENRFAYHPATTPQRQDLHGAVRDACRFLADTLNSYVPEGREKALAFTKIEEAMFWANAAVARQGES